jgi:DNA-directed RNA polymerase subunit RPC12/RpoP
MKVRCSQCGASLPVLEKEFYLRCPHCSARNLLRSPGENVLLVLPARTLDQVRRLFPSTAEVKASLKYYPYRDVDGRLQPFFNSPVPELLGYVPPAGSTTIFSGDAVDPDDLVPMVEAPASDRVVFHPFYVVRSADQTAEKAVHVDAVSGLRPGPASSSSGRAPSLPSSSFIIVLSMGTAFSAITYLLAALSGASIPTALGLSIVAALAGSALAFFMKVQG